jgi:hypothetical protein
MRRWIRSSRLPVEKYGRPDSDDFGSGNTLGWFAPLVDRRAADLGEPDRFALHHPSGVRAEFSAADALVVRVAPPAPDILDAEHPRLAESVGDRRARLRGAGGIVGVVPVVGIAAAQIPAR